MRETETLSAPQVEELSLHLSPPSSSSLYLLLVIYITLLNWALRCLTLRILDPHPSWGSLVLCSPAKAQPVLG